MAARYFRISIPTPLNIDVTKTPMKKYDVLMLLAGSLNAGLHAVFSSYAPYFEDSLEESGNAWLPADLAHELVNMAVYGEKGIPSKFITLDNSIPPKQAPTIAAVPFGRCSSSIVQNRHIPNRQNFLFTFLMPDDTVHVLIVDISFR